MKGLLFHSVRPNGWALSCLPHLHSHCMSGGGLYLFHVCVLALRFTNASSVSLSAWLGSTRFCVNEVARHNQPPVSNAHIAEVKPVCALRNAPTKRVWCNRHLICTDLHANQHSKKPIELHSLLSGSPLDVALQRPRPPDIFPPSAPIDLYWCYLTDRG